MISHSISSSARATAGALRAPVTPPEELRPRIYGNRICLYWPSAPPPAQVLRHEGVIMPFGVGGVDPINALGLAGAQGFMRVEAMDRGHQPLPAQDFVAAGDAAGEVVGYVDDHTVAVGDQAVDGEDLGRD